MPPKSPMFWFNDMPAAMSSGEIRCLSDTDFINSHLVCFVASDVDGYLLADLLNAGWEAKKNAA